MFSQTNQQKLKVWYTTAGHRLAVIAWLMLVKTLFLSFLGKHIVYAKVFRRYWQHFGLLGKTQWFCLILNDRMVG